MGSVRSAALALPLLASGCIAPPILSWDANSTVALELAGYREPFERLEVEVEPDVYLRGLFVDAGDGAPVVLHLLGSGMSTVGESHRANGAVGALPAVETLRANGISSVLMDYRGVGLSDGHRSPDHLARDAELMLAEAERRAPDSRRVAVRAISIGALPAGLLLDAGHRLGAVVLVAPVRNESVTGHYLGRGVARLVPDLFPDLVADGLTAFGLLWVRLPVDLDTETTLSGADSPLLTFSPLEDKYLSTSERVELRAAVEASGGRWVDRGGSHRELSLEGRDLLPGELEFLRTALTDGAAAAAATAPREP